MNAQLRPVLLASERPKYLGWHHVRRNEPEQWIALNLTLIREWWRAGFEHRPDLEYDEMDFQPFCRVQFDLERMRFEELRDDGKYDDLRTAEDE